MVTKNEQLDPLQSKYNKCIQTAVNTGKISKSLAREILESDSPEEAIVDLINQKTLQKRETVIQAIRLADGVDKITNHPSKDAFTGLMSLLTKDISNNATYNNIDTLSKVYRNSYHALWADGLSQFRSKVFGLSDTKTARYLGISNSEKSINKFIEGVFGYQNGIKTDDPIINEAVEAWYKIVDLANKNFNKNGGNIPKNEKWLLPQNHDPSAVTKATYENWRSFLEGKLNRELMVDDQGRQLSDENFEKALRYVYDSITTGGLNKVQDLTIPKLRNKILKRNFEKRFLYFKDSESWIDYQNEFGRGNILTTLTDWMDSIASDTAVLEILGPNPRQTYEILKAEAQKIQLDRKGKINLKQQTQGALLDAVFKVVSGEINQGQMTTLADSITFVRNINIAATLGKATFASVTDLASSAITAHYNNIPAVKVFKRQLSLLNPANEADRVFAAKIGFVFDGWLGRAFSKTRFVDTYGAGASAKAAEVTLRFSGLEAWTESGRKAFSMEFSGMLADNFKKSFDELDPALQRSFNTYQISKQDWDKFRKTELLDFKGSKFADVTKDTSKKFHSMILIEQDYAVPTPDARVRAITSGGVGTNTAVGQLIRSATMIKSFPITVIANHWLRAYTQSTAAGKTAYIGALALSTTLMGSFAIQMKDIANGRNPRPMDDPEDWLNAFVQGGSGSLLADYILADPQKYGSNYLETVLGPMAGLTRKTLDFTFGNAREAVLGDETNIIPESTRFLRDIAPDPWQLSLFFDSMYYNARLMADPSYQATINRIRTQQFRENNSDFWWAPGETPAEVLEDF